MAIFGKSVRKEDAKKLSNENKLSEEQLEAVNGGYVLWIMWGTWEVINDTTGDVMERVEGLYEDAASRAEALGQSPEKVDWAKVQSLRDYVKENQAEPGGPSMPSIGW